MSSLKPAKDTSTRESSGSAAASARTSSAPKAAAGSPRCRAGACSDAAAPARGTWRYAKRANAVLNNGRGDMGILRVGEVFFRGE